MALVSAALLLAISGSACSLVGLGGSDEQPVTTPTLEPDPGDGTVEPVATPTESAPVASPTTTPVRLIIVNDPSELNLSAVDLSQGWTVSSSEYDGDEHYVGLVKGSGDSVGVVDSRVNVHSSIGGAASMLESMRAEASSNFELLEPNIGADS